MYNYYNFDLQYFQQKVIEEYKEIKFIKERDDLYFKDPYNDFTDPAFKQGCSYKFFWSWFLKAAAVIEKKAIQPHRKRLENDEAGKRSKEIIFHPEIRKILCPSLHQVLNPSVLEQEKIFQIIKIVTSLLTKESTAKEFSIDMDSRLFAYMIYEISQEGIEAYCQN